MALESAGRRWKFARRTPPAPSSSLDQSRDGSRVLFFLLSFATSENTNSTSTEYRQRHGLPLYFSSYPACVLDAVSLRFLRIVVVPVAHIFNRPSRVVLACPSRIISAHRVPVASTSQHSAPPALACYVDTLAAAR